MSAATRRQAKGLESEALLEYTLWKDKTTRQVYLIHEGVHSAATEIQYASIK
jgi:hypothetical protein